ncbi:CopD family protein [Bradyrhizobium sp. STM 3557]|uniref:CopD family protein n=1 Tax=Bradyrhizobium sp. STM 3557 TaxID=578920 RepID=UPI00388D1C11
MIYLWLKALHVAAVLVWTGGLLVAALASAGIPKSVTDRPLIEAIQRFDTGVTSPAMFVVWAAGLALAMLGQWFPSPWLIIKLAIVVLLSALHGVLAAKLRGLSLRDTTSPGWLRHVPVAIMASLSAIAILVVVKPF